jgi:hypothetical protein
LTSVFFRFLRLVQVFASLLLLGVRSVLKRAIHNRDSSCENCSAAAAAPPPLPLPPPLPRRRRCRAAAAAAAAFRPSAAAPLNS